jgi:nicotinate-nucleotide adenylyltransferase
LKLGIFGGTFNPVHLAHLIVAEYIREGFGLDRVLFIPSALPPHKDSPTTGAEHRLAMTRLACAGNPHFQVDDIEVRREGRSYSIDTLKELQGQLPGDDFYFIIGMDAFEEIGTWREARALFSLTSFLVIPRPGHPLGDPREFLPPEVMVEETAAGERGPVRHYKVEGGKELLNFQIPVLDISSSDIRKRLRERRSVRYLLPQSVEIYIREKKLYI